MSTLVNKHKVVAFLSTFASVFAASAVVSQGNYSVSAGSAAVLAGLATAIQHVAHNVTGTTEVNGD